MSCKSIAILEDNSERLIQMRSCATEIIPGSEQVYFDSAPKMISWLEDHLGQVLLISLDHDLPIGDDHGTGRQVADYLAAQPPTCPIIVHTSNEFFAPGMVRVLADAGWPVFRVYPHGDQDWVNLGWAEQVRACIRGGWIFE